VEVFLLLVSNVHLEPRGKRSYLNSAVHGDESACIRITIDKVRGEIKLES